jgi:hypothetical protein
LVDTVRELALRAEIGMPQVAIFEGAPNAFATGAFKNSALDAFWEVLSQQPVRILIGAELPRMLGVTEIHGNVSGDGEPFVPRHLGAAIPGKRFVELLRKLAGVFDERVGHGFTVSLLSLSTSMT